jgi:predicted lactoylglutathione lyase
MNLNVTDIKPFIPAKDFELSQSFYQELGWISTWSDDDIAVMANSEHRFYLQNYYVKKWADNSMLYIGVESAQDWYEKVNGMVVGGSYPRIKVRRPKQESYGALVTYVWDPSGVLLHFAQWDS